MFNTGPVFKANYDSPADLVINQGGTDSGKTYAIIQEYVFRACTHPAPKEDPFMTVLNESVPNSKKGAYRTFEGIANNPHVKRSIVHWDKGSRTIVFKTGWVIEFHGATTEQNAKNGKRQYLFVNEANGISYPIFWQYAKRTRIKVTIDYNPSAPFWAHDKFIGTLPEANDLNARVQLIISDHRHNPFLSARDHAKTENIKDKQLWDVYARGKTGNLTGLIYRNWKMIPDNEFPINEGAKFGGLDFGYTNDPTAAVDMRKIKNRVYIHELCYEPGLTEKQLKELFRSRGYKSETPIYCELDHTILRNLRLLNVMAIPAQKGPGSVNAGILKINKELDVYYTASSVNIDFERKRYMWLKNPVTNKPTNEPLDQYNHLMDAIRYGIYTRYGKAA